MSRGGSFGGGKSSLGYLFEPDEANPNLAKLAAKQAQKPPAKENKKTTEADITMAAIKHQEHLFTKPEEKPNTKENEKTTEADTTMAANKHQEHLVTKPEEKEKPHNKETSKTQNAVTFHSTGRSSTRVNSVPGGRSSLGYLFGDN